MTPAEMTFDTVDWAVNVKAPATARTAPERGRLVGVDVKHDTAHPSPCEPPGVA